MERIKRVSKNRQVVNQNPSTAAAEPPPPEPRQQGGTGTHPDLGQGSGLLLLPVLRLPGMMSLSDPYCSYFLPPGAYK